MKIEVILVYLALYALLGSVVVALVKEIKDCRYFSTVLFYVGLVAGLLAIAVYLPGLLTRLGL